MNATLLVLTGLLVSVIAVWHVLRLRSRATHTIPTDWMVALGRIANDQALGHHREARRGALQLVHAMDKIPADSQQAHHLRIRLAGVLSKDPVFPDVVKAIRSACVAEPAVTELALCVRLRHHLIEDIRQCEALAESLGQIRRREGGADALLIARFQQPA